MALLKKIADKLSKRPAPKSKSQRAIRIPPLEAGDRLTRAEFERRYEAMPHLKKAELIEGVVYPHPFVPFTLHGEPHAKIAGLIGLYCSYTPGTSAANNGTVRLDLNNEPQPDVTLLIDEAAGGNTYIDKEDFIAGAPELIVEVAVSNASYDLHDKLNAYRRNGVQEYIVWRVDDSEIDWFCLESEVYVRVKPDAPGIIRSRVFPGLWLNTTALLAGNLDKAITDLQKGLKSKNHAAFVNRLAKKTDAKPSKPLRR